MLIRLLNLLGLLGVSLVLLAAFYYQLFQNELPCPLCLLQRGCFVALGIGFALNLSVGPSRLHDAMMLVSGLLGAGTALRQWLLHIAPGDAGYGSPLLGVHFYTWAFVAFAPRSSMSPCCFSSRRARAARPGGDRRPGPPRPPGSLALRPGGGGQSRSRPCSNAASAPAPTIRPSTSGWVPRRSEAGFAPRANLPLPAPGHPLGG